MMLKRLTQFVLQSRLHASVVAFACAATSLLGMQSDSLLLSVMIVLISTLAIIVASFVTLQHGPKEGAIVLFAASAPYLMGYFLFPQYYELGILKVSVFLILLSNILTWFVAAMLYQYGSWAFALQCLALVGLGLIVLIHLLVPNLPEWWAAQLNISLSKVLLTGLDPADVASEEGLLKTSIAQMKHYMTRSTIIFVWFNTVFQVLLAALWQATVFKPGALKKALYQVRLSNIMGIAFVIALVLAFFANSLVLDLITVFYLTFGFAGFCLAHDFAASKRNGFIVLIAVYGFLPVFILILPMIALLDVWMDFRRRYRLVKV